MNHTAFEVSQRPRPRLQTLRGWLRSRARDVLMLPDMHPHRHAAWRLDMASEVLMHTRYRGRRGRGRRLADEGLLLLDADR
jgi:hypothetical protein